MWVSGSSDTSNPVRTWSVPIWNISEKKEIQRTRAGMYIPQVRPFKGLKFWIMVYWSFNVGVYSQMSCHPELNQYIQDTLHCMKPLIEKVIYWPIRWLIWGNHITSVICISPIWFFFSERCGEGGCCHHGQGASPSREICVWDFPTNTPVNKVRIWWLLFIFMCVCGFVLKGSRQWVYLFLLLQLRLIAVTCGAAAEGIHSEDKCVRRRFKQ